MLRITGSKTRLAQLGRKLGATVEENPRTETPVLVVNASPLCPYVAAGTLPDGRVSAMRGDTQSWEFLSMDLFIRAVRGLTEDECERIIAAESHRRMSAIRTRLDTDRRIRTGTDD